MPDKEFEKTFADLAHARLRDRAPGLLDYLVGFQLLDKSDDDTHAVGVWGFKVGNEWMYAPVFFLNGQLKGDDLLYIKSQDAFVPLKENWINYLLNRRPHVLGEPEEKKQNELGIMQPDFDVMARPPYMGSKSAADNGMRSLVDWMNSSVGKDFRAFMPVVVSGPGDTKYASLDAKWSLPEFVKSAGRKAAVTLFQTMKKNAAFADAVLRFYRIEELVKAAESAIRKTALTKMAADGDRYIKGTAPAVKVIFADRQDPMGFETANMTDAEKEKLQRDRYIVKDRRGQTQLSTVYHREIAKTLQAPGMSGYCRVMTKLGTMKPHLVILNPVGPSRRTSTRKGDALVVNLDSGNRMVMMPPSSIFTDAMAHDKMAWESKFNNMGSLDSGREKDKLVFVNVSCEGSVPFFVKRKVTNDKGQTTYYGDFDPFPKKYMSGRDENTRDMLYPRFNGRKFNVSDSGWRNSGEDYESPVGCGSDISFVITGKDGKKITQIGDTYFVPNGYKLLKISEQDIEPWKIRDYERDRNGETINGIKVPARTPSPDELASPQTLADIEMQLFKSGMLTEIQPITDGIEYWIRTNGDMGRPMRKLAALEKLIVNHQLREADALAMLKTASKNGAPKYFIKEAQGQPYASPAFPDPMMTNDPSLGVPTQYPQTDLLTVGSDTEQLGSNQMDMDATFRAQQASQQGQKEVMDTSVISGLIKTMDVDTVVDNYIGDLMLGLDRVGRILFMFYWHWDKFKERYGQQDMPELEDNLKNVFDNLGDLTIFLKQKTIEPDVSGAEAENDLQPVM